jgi:hypothetical protein
MINLLKGGRLERVVSSFYTYKEIIFYIYFILAVVGSRTGALVQAEFCFHHLLALSFASVTTSRPFHVSSPRLVKRSMWISHTTLSYMLHTKIYVTYRTGVAFTNDKPLATPLLPAEAFTLP